MTDIFIAREKLHRRIQELRHRAYQEGYHQGQQDGLRRGQQQGSARILSLCLQQRLGSLDEELQDWIDGLSFRDLQALANQLPEIESLAALQIWLEQCYASRL